MPDRASPSMALLAPTVRAFVQRHRLPAESVRADGKLVLTIDGQYRVHVVQAPHQRVAIQSELLPLPDHPDSRTDELVLHLMQAAAGLLKDHASTLCIDRRRQAVVLQLLVAPTADEREFEEALAAFTNALAFWHRLRRELTRPRGVPA